MLANAMACEPAGRRCRHRARHDRRDAGGGRRQRPDGEGRVVGGPHGREDGAGDGDRARRAGPDRVARRLGRRPADRPGPAVPRPPRCGPDLLQPGPAVGAGAAGLLSVRSVGGGRRLRAVVLRRRVHGRRQRVDVPRVAAHGRDGRRRDHHARGDGRGPHARVAVGVRRQPGHRRPRRDRPGPGVPDVLPPLVARTTRRCTRASRPEVELADDVVPADERVPFDMHTRDRRDRRPAQLLRDQAAVRPGADRRARPARRSSGRRRRQQLGPSRRHAVRRLGRQGGPVHLVLRRVQHAADLPRRRARVHDRRRRSSARGSSATGRRWSPR